MSNRSMDRDKDNKNNIVTEASTIKLVSTYGDIVNEDVKLGEALKSNVGSSDTQHGEAAEKLEVRNRNREHYLKGEEASAKTESNRTHETADIYDNGEAYQVKFCKTPGKTLYALVNLKHDYTGVKKIVPKEQYDEIIRLCDKYAAKYEKLAEECKAKGDMEGYEHYKELERRYKDVKETAEPSTEQNTRDEAIAASKHPGLTTAKYIIQDAASAGLQAGIITAAVTAATQTFTDLCKVMDGDMELKEAVEDVAVTTGKAATKSAATTAVKVAGVGAFKAIADKIGNETLKKIADNSTQALYMITSAYSYAKILKAYFDGDMSTERMIYSVGETTTGLAASGAATYIFAASGPASAVVLSTVASMAATEVYREIATAVMDRKEAKEHKERVISECSKAIEIIHEYRDAMNLSAKVYLQECTDIFNEGFSVIDRALVIGDYDTIIATNVRMQEFMGKKAQFATLEEFDNLMNSDEAFRL